MNSVWLVFPVANEAAFRAFYNVRGIRGRDNDRRGKSEQVQYNAEGTHGFVASSRARPALQSLIQIKPPWLEIYTTWPPPGGWNYPP